jgi:hypothetical protein
VLSADVVRAAAVRTASKVIGVVLGIAFAFWQDVDLVALYHGLARDGTAKVCGLEHVLHVTLSGVALGLGAGPVHKLITAIERANKKRSEKKTEKTKEGTSV